MPRPAVIDDAWQQTLPEHLQPLGQLLTRHNDALGKRFEDWTQRQEILTSKLLSASDTQIQLLKTLQPRTKLADYTLDDYGIADAELLNPLALTPAKAMTFSPSADNIDLDLHPVPEKVEKDSAAVLTAVEDDDQPILGRGSRSFPLRKLWARSRQSVATSNRISGCTRGVELAMKTAEPELAGDSESQVPIDAQHGWWTPFIALPGSRYRLLWDLLGGLLIGYDVFMIPLRVFDPPDNDFTIFMDNLTLVFWTLNVFATLTAGYISGGVIVISPLRIFLNYLKSWFIVDVVVLVPDYIFAFVATDSSGGGGESVKMLRGLRLARTVRLLRLLKLKWIMDAINDYLDSEYSSIILSIVKMLVILFVISHFIGCMWFALAKMQEGERTWVNFKDEFTYESWTYQYLTALHWALTQFTPAGMHVQPQNMLERTFAILVVLFALVGFAYIIGSITGSIAQLRSMSEQVTKDFWLLRRYLKKNNVPVTLSLRIQKFIEHFHAHSQKQMTSDQVKLLKTLSRQLSEELQCAINLPHMNIHPLFKVLGERSVITMNRVATDCVTRGHMAKGDTMFELDQRCSYMYFIANGRLKYTRTIDEEDVAEFVDREDWVSEPVLWTAAWFHVGTAVAHSECEVLYISPKPFEDVLSLVKPVASLVSEYGRRLIAWVGSMEHLNDVIQGDKFGSTIRRFIPEDHAHM
eukprot:TRINITY_DN9724_c0_g1_i1.p1 TRINITY_DN9724_c0_g1~~TRINITY_DN9724_c0_g1_i1.p1  ORF type:complete len:694 (-),score=96.95 TRINITY_DN9724_c0_g1_i1:180-2261(-)